MDINVLIRYITYKDFVVLLIEGDINEVLIFVIKHRIRKFVFCVK